MLIETVGKINLGKMDGLDEKSLGAALESAGAPGGKLLRTELRGTYSYGYVATRRQGEIIHGLGFGQANRPDVEEFAKAVARELRNSGPF